MALRGASLYEHGALFLTSDPGKAENYAKRAFICGETGYSAYWLYRGARWFGYEMTVFRQASVSLKIIGRFSRHH